MPSFNRISAIWRRLVHRTQIETELNAELRAFVDQLSDEKTQQGMTPRDARHAALMEMGGMEQVKEACRDEWSLSWLDSVIADIRYGSRSLLRTPGFANRSSCNRTRIGTERGALHFFI
jgi:putative ABC transport system permease protein